jgi:chromosome partitioning protein
MYWSDIMKITAIGTLKGGVGKTAMTFNLAGALAEKCKVLLIDIDPQCNLSNNVGVDVTEQDVYSCRDIFETPGVKPNDLVVHHPIPELPNLDIIPSNIMLTATELHIGSRAARERILLNYIEDHKSFFKKYDHILIDTNPSIGIVNQNAFLAADSIILVTDVDDNSRIGLHLFMYLWEEIRRDLRKPNNIKALILNKADVRTSLTEQIYDYCKDDEDLGAILVPQPIRAKVAYARAALARVPVTKYKGGEEAAEEIYKVIEILEERGVF